MEVVPVIKCQSFDDFVSKIRLAHTTKWRLFRGHREPSWRLIPVAFRGMVNERKGIHLRNERIMLDRKSEEFRRLIRALPHVPHDALQDVAQLWAFGRHHGLSTPLLDWTQSPYVAAFFAYFDCMDQCAPGWRTGDLKQFGAPAHPVIVWEFRYGDTDPKFEDLRVFEPLAAAPSRQRAQASWCTHLDSDETADLEEYLRVRNRLDLLTKYELPGREMIRALVSLEQMNIRYNVLFPDVDGAAIQANIFFAMGFLQGIASLPPDSND